MRPTTSSYFFNLLYNFLYKNYGLKVFNKNKIFRRFFGDKNVDGVGEGAINHQIVNYKLSKIIKSEHCKKIIINQLKK